MSYIYDISSLRVKGLCYFNVQWMQYMQQQYTYSNDI